MTLPDVSIDKYLQDIGSCWRCALRFTRERSPEKYSVKSKENDEPEKKILKTSPCVICVGLIQDNYFEDGLEEVVEKINKSDYDAKTYSCQLSIPVSTMLREHAAWLMLVQKFPDVLANATKADFVTSLKDVWKFITTEQMEEKIGKKFELNTSAFQIQVSISYKDDESECSCLVEMCPEKFKQRYKQTRVYKQGIFTRNAVTSVLSEVRDETFMKHYTLKDPTTKVSYGEVVCSHASIHIAGRYNKFSRKLSQTPWIIEGEKRMETSVQELICQFLEPFFKVQSCKFSSSGREDVDVRTLGKGRPFAVELLDPHRISCVQKQINELKDLINRNTDDISVNDLQLVTKEQLLPMKEGEEEKTKNYSALCVMLDGQPISQQELSKLDVITELVVQQKTPLRVLHRRSLAVRPKTIHDMKTQLLTERPDHFILRLKTQAGTYIKEFVHGDFNRSTPNVCTVLGRPVDIVALDVDHVELDWPPPVNYIQ